MQEIQGLHLASLHLVEDTVKLKTGCNEKLVVIPSSLDDDGSLVVAEGNVVGSWEGGQGPNALVPVVKRALLRVSRSGHYRCSFC